jgi:hypothetical protein
MPAGLSFVRGDVVLELNAAASTVNSGAVAAPAEGGPMIVGAHITTAGGTTPTLDVTVEQSANGSTGWATVTGSALAQITAAGNRVGFVAPTQPYVRIVATIGGTTPTFTGRIAVAMFTD